MKRPLTMELKKSHSCLAWGCRALQLTSWFFGFVVMVIAACGGPGVDNTAGVAPLSASGTEHLTAAEVQLIIAQAATQAQASGLPVTIAVVDHEGIVLGVLRMAGAQVNTTIQGGGSGGLEGLSVPAANGAISKAGTAAFFSTQGNAFTTRTASFIIQEHFPPQVSPSPGGPLFGVQFSQLQCSDVARTGHAPGMANLPLGLSADPGGLPLYKNGIAVGGIGVEGDGLYTLNRDPTNVAPTTEETIAAAGTLNFSAPPGIRGDQILVDGIRLPFANAEPPAAQSTIPYANFVAAGGTQLVVPTTSPATGFVPAVVGGVSGTVDPNFFPFKAGTDGRLTVTDVTQVIGQAAAQAVITRAAIRNPIGSQAEVSITVVDTAGVILGIFRTPDAPLFGFDVSAQKARAANFFTRPTAAAEFTTAGLGGYVAAAQNDGLALNGSLAFSDRAVGFLSQPFYPPGAIAPFGNGPFSKPLGNWSIFNTGLQLDLITSLTAPGPCTAIAQLPNGIQIFPGSIPLYKNGIQVGAVGISGDGVDQDDYIAFGGSVGFEAPVNIRSDTVSVLGTPLPWQVFPRHPNL